MSVSPKPLPAGGQTTATGAGPTGAGPVSWLQRIQSSGGKLLTGGAVLLVSTTIVNLGNYVFNLIMGRWLGPAAFADVSLLITLFLVVTLITATLQTVAARFAAIYAAGSEAEHLAGLRRWGLAWAWGIGLASTLIMAGGALYWQQFFQTQSFWPFVILGVGVPVYYAQGVDRGLLQGMLRFGRLALSYQAEMWARLFLGVVLVAAGFAINGAVAALSLSFVATWFVARTVRRGLPATRVFAREEVQAAAKYSGPVAVALLGQILINNSDVLLVKHYFAPADAGQYAALALIGRIVFFATWSVVMVLLPSVAQRHAQGLPHRHLLWQSLALVGAASVAVVGACWFGDKLVMGLLFGADYLGVAPLLWVYALATTLYALANVFITYGLSLGQQTGSWLALGAGVVQVAAIVVWHESLATVVLVQVVVMAALVVVLGARQVLSADGLRRADAAERG